MKKIILITGVAGMVGTNLLKKIINKKDTIIIGIDNLILGKKKFLNPYLNKDNFFFIKMDLGKKVKVKFVEDRPGHDMRYALNCNKIKKKLKWKTKKSFRNGLKETLEWYINNKKFFNYFSKKLFFKRLGLGV